LTSHPAWAIVWASPREKGIILMARHRERPSLTVDIVVLTGMERELRVLLIRRGCEPFAGRWALPGGFVEPNEPLRDAARRELWEETGLHADHLEEVGAFGDPGRDPRGWTVSVAYLVALESEDARDQPVRAGSDAREVAWCVRSQLPSLAFDHQEIIAQAVDQLDTRLCSGGRM
jgi:8-oxo-dGTP diphosphatase